ncbi:MAG: putrescine ABC transporter permease PotH, partial [Methylibium sp.]
MSGGPDLMARVRQVPLLGRLAGLLGGRRSVIGIPYVWLLVFFLFPFLIVMKISVSEMENVHFKDLITVSDGVMNLSLKFSNYIYITQDDLYFSTYLSSLKYAAVTTVLCLAIGYPFAYFMARAKATLQPALLMLVMLPFWTSLLLRVYAWKGLLGENGWVADLLIALRIDHLLLA